MSWIGAGDFGSVMILVQGTAWASSPMIPTRIGVGDGVLVSADAAAVGTGHRATARVAIAMYVHVQTSVISHRESISDDESCASSTTAAGTACRLPGE